MWIQHKTPQAIAFLMLKYVFVHTFLILFWAKDCIMTLVSVMYKCTYLKNTEWREDRNFQKVILTWSKAKLEKFRIFLN